MDIDLVIQRMFEVLFLLATVTLTIAPKYNDWGVTLLRVLNIWCASLSAPPQVFSVILCMSWNTYCFHKMNHVYFVGFCIFI